MGSRSRDADRGRRRGTSDIKAAQRKLTSDTVCDSNNDKQKRVEQLMPEPPAEPDDEEDHVLEDPYGGVLEDPYGVLEYSFEVVDDEKEAPTGEPEKPPEP